MFEVRQTALTTLMHCFDCQPPSPNTSHYYLELMARKRPHVDTPGKKWEFDPQEPWVFFETMIEKVLKEEEGCAGAALCLQLIVQFLEKDIHGWLDEQVESDSLSIPNWRPLVSHVLFPQSSVAWGRRMEHLCSLYARFALLDIFKMGCHQYYCTVFFVPHFGVSTIYHLYY